MISHKGGQERNLAVCQCVEIVCQRNLEWPVSQVMEDVAKIKNKKRFFSHSFYYHVFIFCIKLQRVVLIGSQGRCKIVLLLLLPGGLIQL